MGIILNNLVTMVTNIANPERGILCEASSTRGSHGCTKTFDGTLSEQWVSDEGVGCWTEYSWASTVDIIKTRLASGGSSPGEFIKECLLEFSDGTQVSVSIVTTCIYYIYTYYYSC